MTVPLCMIHLSVHLTIMSVCVIILIVLIIPVSTIIFLFILWSIVILVLLLLIMVVMIVMVVMISSIIRTTSFPSSTLLCKPIPFLSNTLREINFNPSIINQGIIHFKICFSACLLSIKFNKCILERIPRISITYNFSFGIGIKS